MSALLSVRDLRTHVDGERGTVRAVDGVSFDVAAGEVVCLVGETGSGKTATCESLTRLLPPRAEVVGGSVAFDGEDLTAASPARLREVRGARIGHVFQHPHEALDPVYTVGEQVAECVAENTDLSGEAARARAIALLDRVGLPAPADRFDDYPAELSGGMRQRAVIATALAGDPDLLVADEPTTALDVTTEAAVLDLFEELRAERGVGVLLVTHDLGVVAEVADRVVVVYGGTVVERGHVGDVFERPRHPYTRALLRSHPGRDGERDTLDGDPIDPTDPPPGCRFAPRCPHAVPACRADRPPLYDVGDGHEAACVYYDGERDPTAILDGGDEE